MWKQKTSKAHPCIIYPLSSALMSIIIIISVYHRLANTDTIGLDIKSPLYHVNFFNGWCHPNIFYSLSIYTWICIGKFTTHSIVSTQDVVYRERFCTRSQTQTIYGNIQIYFSPCMLHWLTWFSKIFPSCFSKWEQQAALFFFLPNFRYTHALIANKLSVS